MATNLTLSLRQESGSLGSPLSATPQTPLTPSTPSSLRSLNPLSTKVSTVLSTSYADAEFRDALALLDERGVQNTPHTRRQLRLDLQKEVIDTNGEIIDEFGRVAEQLKKIGSTIQQLNRSFGEMKSQLTAAHSATSSMLQEASNIMSKRQEVEEKQQVLQQFREHFILSNPEVAALTLTSEPVDDTFFAALAKAKRISKDCEILLGLENQTLGLEIMEQTSKTLNSAFQKLYRWIQREFKSLNLENPQISSSIRQALRVLAERPSLFQNCLDFFAEAREHILSEAFYTALTGTTPSGQEDRSVKPIEMGAHDALRYVGDMLAWVHSATVGEREALEGLFVSEGDELAAQVRASRETEVWRRVLAEDYDEGTAAREGGEGAEETGFDAVKALNELVDRDVAGVAHMLRQRVEQVVRANEDTILAYRIAVLLDFYRVTFAKLLLSKGGRGSAAVTADPASSPESSVLIESLDKLEAEASRQFRSLVREHVATLQGAGGEFSHPPPADLGPPDFFVDALKQLSTVARTFETSLAAADGGFDAILAEALDPFLAGCDAMARRAAPSADQGDDGAAGLAAAVFAVNCLSAARATLAPFEFARPRIARLDDALRERLALLALHQYAYLRRESGLEALFAALSVLDPARADDVRKVAEGRVDAATPPHLTEAGRELDEFLPSALMDAMDQVRQLGDAAVARKVTEEAAERFCDEFEHVELLLIRADELREVREDEDEEEDETKEDPDRPALRSLFPRTSGEIRVLLS